MDCGEITTKIIDYKTRADALVDSLIDLKDVDQIVSDLDGLESHIAETLKVIDPNQLALRQELAKKLDVDYVGPIIGDRAAMAVTLRGEHILSSRDSVCQIFNIETGVAISDIYARITPFFQGIAWAEAHVSIQGVATIVKHSLINDQGETVYQFPTGMTILYESRDWEGSPIPVKTRPDHISYINRDGKHILKAARAKSFIFYDGVIWADNQGRQTLFDEDGKEVFTLPESFSMLDVYHNGYCLGFRIPTDGSKEAKVYKIDKKGRVEELDGIFVDAEWLNKTDRLDAKIHYENGLYYCWNKSEGYFTLRIDGSKTVYGKAGEGKKDWSLERVVNDRLFIMSLENGNDLVGLVVNTEGETPGNIMMTNKGDFVEDMMWFESFFDGKYYFLDRNGEKIGEGYDEVKDFSEGLAAVRDDRGWFFIDNKGKNNFLDKHKRFSALPDPVIQGFVGGVIQVEDEGEKYFIDRWGRRVFG